MLKYSECIPSNATAELCIRIPSTSARLSSPEHTLTSLHIAITQDDSIRTIHSPTHQKLLSIKAGPLEHAREFESFDALEHNDLVSNLDQLNQATVTLSANHAAFDREFELVIKTSNEAEKTGALLSAINRFGHAVLSIIIRPCELFNGDEDTEWLIRVDLDHPWNICSSDLRDLNLTRIPHDEANMSPGTFKFVQTPKILPKVSHLQHQSVCFLLDFKGSTQYALDSVRITASSMSRNHIAETKTLNVVRSGTVEMTLQQLCVGGILRDLYGTIMSRKLERHHSKSEGQSLGLSNLVSNAERLGQMYDLCSHWTSKLAASSIHDGEDGNANGPALYEDELSRFVTPAAPNPMDRLDTRWSSYAPEARQDIMPALHENPGKRSAAFSEATSRLLNSDSGYAGNGSPSRTMNGRHSPLDPIYDPSSSIVRCSIVARPDSSPRFQAPSSHPSTETYATPLRQNEYFVPEDRIEREVIQADIRRYLGNEAEVRPGIYEDKKNGRELQGYFVTAYRNLTSSMIADLEADSVRWRYERTSIYPGKSRCITTKRPATSGRETGTKSVKDSQTGSPYFASVSPTAGMSLRYSIDDAGQSRPYYHWQGPNFEVKLPSDPPRDVRVVSSEKRPELDQQCHELHPIWLRIKACQSVYGTNQLPVDLRNEIESRFIHGTWRWLSARIDRSLADESGPTTFGTVVDTMLILAFTWVYIRDHYRDVEEQVDLILENAYDQRAIFEELVSRVVAK